MTVKELVKFLEKYPDDLRVVVNGYEDGYDDISPNRIFTRKIQLDAGTPDWEGQHGDPPYESEEKIGDAKIVEALVFHRAPYY
ncbi:hypothetical protein F4X88_12150 [Candidatus Poribacteria bacterium]|nr:hypothetical protein [Candidatus Poribacteria bacterium]MYA57043.1 hypothetical protein [Candidatus Poribacteria bacterium]